MSVYRVPAWKEKILIKNGADAEDIKSITSDAELTEYMKANGLDFKPITPSGQAVPKPGDLPPIDISPPNAEKAEITNAAGGIAQPIDLYDLHLKSEYQPHINPESRILRRDDGFGGSTIIG